MLLMLSKWCCCSRKMVISLIMMQLLCFYFVYCNCLENRLVVLTVPLLSVVGILPAYESISTN